MRRLQTKSIEELLDIEEALHSSRDEDKAGSMHEVISLYEELHKRIKRDKASEYISSLKSIEKKLVSYLIRYGTYLKTEYQKDDFAAKRTLSKALNYDRTNPIARYRLGFIAYKERNFMESIKQFQQVLEPQNRNTSEYELTSQQNYNAGLYLSNSALYIAKEAQASLEKIEGDLVRTGISNLEMSPLYEIIKQNETYLQNHAFSITSQKEVTMCSKDECERLIDSDCSEQIILYFSDSGHSVFYKGQEVSLSINQAEMLKIFMLESNEKRPATKHEFDSIFNLEEDGTEIPDNTYIIAVRRLRVKLDRCRIPIPLIITKRYRDETGYYYDQTVPYLVIQRADDV